MPKLQLEPTFDIQTELLAEKYKKHRQWYAEVARSLGIESDAHSNDALDIAGKLYYFIASADDVVDSLTQERFGVEYRKAFKVTHDCWFHALLTGDLDYSDDELQILTRFPEAAQYCTVLADIHKDIVSLCQSQTSSAQDSLELEARIFHSLREIIMANKETCDYSLMFDQTSSLSRFIHITRGILTPFFATQFLLLEKPGAESPEERFALVKALDAAIPQMLDDLDDLKNDIHDGNFRSPLQLLKAKAEISEAVLTALDANQSVDTILHLEPARTLSEIYAKNGMLTDAQGEALCLQLLCNTDAEQASSLRDIVQKRIHEYERLKGFISDKTNDQTNNIIELVKTSGIESNIIELFQSFIEKSNKTTPFLLVFAPYMKKLEKLLQEY